MSLDRSTVARTIVGISGGVDSSVAALLLREAGEPIAGLFMQNWTDDEAQGRASVVGGRMPRATGSGEAQDSASVAAGRTPKATDCRAEDDRRDAVAVCGRLGLPIHFRDFSREYWDGVFSHFIAEYAAGRTPNPDVLCNREIKFRHFLDAARELGAQYIATGHYARIAPLRRGHALLRAADRSKDQSYFLHQLGQQALSATKFPLGDLPKTQVRRMALDAGLPTAAKKDSTGICFIGERDFRAFLGRYLPARQGEIRTPDGQAIGEHPGVFYFTLGQREGLNIGGLRGFGPGPWYVVGKDVAANVLYVDQGTDSPWLQSSRLQTEPAHWIAGSAPAQRFDCAAQTRYRQAEEACDVLVRDDTTLEVRFHRPQRAVTPGQSLVLYDGDVCLGGAVIASTDARLETTFRSLTASSDRA
ncbi:MAG: tRNA 2-thiouridine(34) synthase MnmA [Pseudomonadota bacterium]|nr:tRNA 2-thiouridine(34) synthase MnmA [Pseudomonadota bacterium]